MTFIYEETNKKQKVLPPAHMPGNTTQPISTLGFEERIAWSQTLNTLNLSANLREDSDGMMDADGEKLRKGLRFLQWVGVRLPDKQVEFAYKF